MNGLDDTHTWFKSEVSGLDNWPYSLGPAGLNDTHTCGLSLKWVV